MAKTKQQKEVEVKKIADNFSEAKSVVFTSYTGLNVSQTQSLRNQLRSEGISYIACKKSLLKKFLADQKINDANVENFEGSLAVAFGQTDEIAPAKLLAKFAQEFEALKIHGGILEGGFIAADKVMELSKLPSKDELIAKVVGSINAPISGFVNVLAGNLRGFVNVLNAIKEKQA